MRKLTHILLAGSMFTLAACGTLPFPSPTTPAQFVADTIALCRTGCSFIPDVSVVTAILATADPLLSTPGLVASAICKLVGTSPGPLGAKRGVKFRTKLEINGVPITGHFE